jgi:phage portal protein BeeE
MSALQWLLRRIGYERRSADPYWANFSALRSGAVTPARAQSVSAVYACVAAISETIASLPLILYRRTPEGGRDRATDHSLYRVLHDQPNDIQTALEFREQLQAAVLLRADRLWLRRTGARAGADPSRPRPSLRTGERTAGL